MVASPQFCRHSCKNGSGIIWDSWISHYCQRSVGWLHVGKRLANVCSLHLIERVILDAFHRWHVLLSFGSAFKFSLFTRSLGHKNFPLQFTGILWVLWGELFRRLHPRMGSGQWWVYHRLRRVAERISNQLMHIEHRKYCWPATVQVISRIYHQVQRAYLREGRELPMDKTGEH